MKTVNIEYRIRLDEERTERFVFKLDGETFDLKGRKPKDLPNWTSLEFNQCSHCPLTPEEYPHCPLASRLHDIVERFHDTRSFDEVELEVVTEERRVIQTLDIQQALASILDLIMPVCGCPKTAYMRPLARFHLPLASEEETVFRVTGMYLLAQYFLSHSSTRARIELDGLNGIYQDLHIVNTSVARRLMDVTRSDSLKNAFALTDTYSILVPLLVDDKLVEMRGFFESYLQGVEPSELPPAEAPNNLEKIKALKLNLELVPMEGEAEISDRPSWLKAALGEVEPDPGGFAERSREEKIGDPQKAFDRQQKKLIDSILGKSGLSLELEPMAPPGDEKKSAGDKGKPGS